MWPPWGRASSPRVHSASPRPNFRCSSFKDVHILCSSDDSSLDENHGLHRHRHTQPPSSPSTKKIFHRVRVASTLLRNWPARPEPPPSRTRAAPVPSRNQPDAIQPTPVPEQEQPQAAPRIWLPGTETRIVVYYTSLRVVRPTFDACRSVQSILNGFRAAVDGRDVAMYSGFLEELQQILGVAKEKLTLPRVFVGGRYIGGAEEVRQLYETGELKKLVEGLPTASPGVCDACGGYRFVVCADCNGSHKVYSDKGGFRSCTACNENGLIKCPTCYPTALAP